MENFIRECNQVSFKDISTPRSIVHFPKPEAFYDAFPLCGFLKIEEKFQSNTSNLRKFTDYSVANANIVTLRAD